MTLSFQPVRARRKDRALLQSVADLLRQGQEDLVRRLIRDVSARSVGPFRDEAAAIGFLRDRLVSRLRPRMIWLFGSRARGDTRDDSDFDLLVVLPNGLPPDAYSHMTVAEPLIACGVGVDVVPASWADFVTDRNVPTTLVHRATTEGRLLYQKRPRRAVQTGR